MSTKTERLLEAYQRAYEEAYERLSGADQDEFDATIGVELDELLKDPEDAPEARATLQD